MATYVLIPGAGGDAWFWHLVARELEEHGHDAVPVDLPAEDDSAGFREYADAVVDAIGDRTDLILVAHSLGGFTAPLVCTRVAVDLLVLVTAMIPSHGESAGEWWDSTGHAQARAEQAERDGRTLGGDDDVADAFFRGLAHDLVVEAKRRERDQSGTPFAAPWPLETWPDVPTRFVLCRDDRFFPAEFMRRVVRERLGIAPDEIDAGHTVALSHPRELAELLQTYRVTP